MSLNNIAIKLQESVGIEAELLGYDLFEQRVSQRMSVCKQTSLDSYYQLVCHSARELALLVEELVISETWFFRDQGIFDQLQVYLQKMMNHIRGFWLYLDQL